MRKKLSLKNRIYQHSIAKSMRFYLENLIIYIVRMLKRQKIISEVRHLVDFVVLHIQGINFSNIYLVLELGTAHEFLYITGVTFRRMQYDIPLKSS